MWTKISNNGVYIAEKKSWKFRGDKGVKISCLLEDSYLIVNSCNKTYAFFTIDQVIHFVFHIGTRCADGKCR